MKMRNFGKKSLDEIKQVLSREGALAAPSVAWKINAAFDCL